jgi:hypothetical protein
MVTVTASGVPISPDLAQGAIERQLDRFVIELSLVPQ